MSQEADRTYIGVFLTGAVVGVGLALLFAPKSGRELREDLRRATRNAGDELKSRKDELDDQMSAVLDDIAIKAEELSRSGKDMVEERRRALMAAIEAGKRAYELERLRAESERRSGEAAAAASAMGT